MIRKFVSCKFVEDFHIKKTKKLQDSIHKQFFIACLIGGLQLLATLLFELPAVSAHISNDTKIFVAVLFQLFTGTASITWTVAFLYGEIDLARELVRSV